MEQLPALPPTWGLQASGDKYSTDIKGGFRVNLGEGYSPPTTHTPDHFLAPQDFRAENVFLPWTHGGPLRAQICFNHILLRIRKAGTMSPWLCALRIPWAGIKLRGPPPHGPLEAKTADGKENRNTAILFITFSFLSCFTSPFPTVQSFCLEGFSLFHPLEKSSLFWYRKTIETKERRKEK